MDYGRLRGGSRLRSRRVARDVHRVRAEVGEHGVGDRSVERVERRIYAEGLRKIELRGDAIAELGVNHAGVEEKARVGGALGERLCDGTLRLRIPAVLVVRPGQRVRGEDVRAALVLRLGDRERLGEPAVEVRG